MVRVLPPDEEATAVVQQPSGRVLAVVAVAVASYSLLVETSVEVARDCNQNVRNRLADPNTHCDEPCCTTCRQPLVLPE